MKNKFLILLMLLSASASYAQNTEGLIIYEQKINMHRRIQDEAMKAMVPEFRTQKMQLAVKGAQSLYKNVEESGDEEINSQSNGQTTRMVFRAPAAEVFRDFDTQTLTELRELAGRKFIIQDSLKRIAWKLNPSVTRKINGYECMQATATQPGMQGGIVMSFGGPGGGGAPRPATPGATPPPPAEQKVVAWFTDAVPVPGGPGQYGGLPGLVMLVDINDGETVISATKVELRAVTEKEMKKPSGGKKVTEKEFNKVRDDYMQEVRKQGGMMRIGG